MLVAPTAYVCVLSEVFTVSPLEGGIFCAWESSCAHNGWSRRGGLSSHVVNHSRAVREIGLVLKWIDLYHGVPSAQRPKTI